MKKLIFTLLTVITLGLCNTSQTPDNQQGICNPTAELHNCQSHKSLTGSYLPYEPNQNVIIIGVNGVDTKRLIDAQKLLKSFYRFDSEIKMYHYDIEDKFYLDENKTIVNADYLVKSYYSNDRVIFITDKQMYSQNTYLRGYTTVKGKIIITTSDDFMEETIIHEVGHTYGLLHCSNKKCVMAIYNDEVDSGTFCEKCKNDINFY